MEVEQSLPSENLPIHALINATASTLDVDIDTSITLDLNLEYHNPRAAQSSNLIQITESFEPESVSTNLINVHLSQGQGSNSNSIPDGLSPPKHFPNLSSPKKSSPFIFPKRLPTTPPKSSPTPAKDKGSPIPILIRRADNSPTKHHQPPHVFPASHTDATDLEGNALN